MRNQCVSRVVCPNESVLGSLRKGRSGRSESAVKRAWYSPWIWNLIESGFGGENGVRPVSNTKRGLNSVPVVSSDAGGGGGTGRDVGVSVTSGGGGSAGWASSDGDQHTSAAARAERNGARKTRPTGRRE